MAGYRVRSVRLLEPGDLGGVKRELLGGDGVVEVLELGGADDRRRHPGLVQEPGEGHLRCRHAACGGDFGNAVDDGEVELRRIEAVSPGVGASACRQLLALARAVAGKEAAGERAPGQHGDPLIDALRDHLPLLLAVDEVVVVLHGHEARGRDGLRLGELPGEHAARADVSRLACADHVVQRFHRLLDRSPRVPAVDLVEVDVVEAEPLQRGVDRGEHVLARQARAVHPGHRSAVHLRGDDVLLARGEQLLQQAAGDHLALAAVVDVCGVEEDDAALRRPAHDRFRSLFVERPGPLVATAIAHHPEADPRDAQAGPAEVHIVHGRTLSRPEASESTLRVAHDYAVAARSRFARDDSVCRVDADSSTFLSRIDCGVTSTASSSRMNSSACSSDSGRGGISRTVSSAAAARMFVSFLGFDAFTSRSLSREFSPTTIPSYSSSPGATKSDPRSCRFVIANAVAWPRRSATRLPLGRVRSSPCHGSHISNTWCRIPVPRDSVRNSVRKPINARAGTRYSMRAQPVPWFTICCSRPLRSASSCVTTPMNSSGMSIATRSTGSSRLPSTSFVNTSGLPTVSSKPSRRISSMRIASCSSPRPCTSQASGRAVGRTRKETLPTSSASRRCLTWLAVSRVPSVPASGLVLIPIVTDKLGSSTVVTGSGRGSSGSAMVSPIVTSGSPASATISPGPASSAGTRSSASVMYSSVTRACSIVPSERHHAIGAPLRNVPWRIRNSASRPTYGLASRFVTSACSGCSVSYSGAGIVSSSVVNKGPRSGASSSAASPARPARAFANTIGNSICELFASRSRNSSYTSFTTSAGRASLRSTLLITSTTGNFSSSAFRRTNRVCGSGPSDASTSSSTPSTIVRARSTSPPKSAWPGVSTMLILVSPSDTAVFLARIVMPFSRSRSIESITRSATSWFSRKEPDCQSIASTSVVFPWSTCATIATLRRSLRRASTTSACDAGRGRSA